METSAKANINIENVSTATFLFHLLSFCTTEQPEHLPVPTGCKTQLVGIADGLFSIYPCIPRRRCLTNVMLIYLN